MFLYCKYLEGGKGTKYKFEYRNAEYARIDGGSSAPGYFTARVSNLSTSITGGGTVDADKNKDILAGDTVTLTVKADEGYVLKSITVNGGKVELTNNEDGSYTFRMPGGETKVEAVFDVESRFNARTGTLILKGNLVKGSDEFDSIVLPNGVNIVDVKHIVVAPSGATFPENSSYLFCEFGQLQSINLVGADTSNVTDMTGMFKKCTQMTTFRTRGL